MAATPSTMIPLGTLAPSFTLIDAKTEKCVFLTEIKGAKGTVVIFICNHCPYVKLINSELVAVANEYIPQGIGFVAISSNDAVQYPDDGPEHMKRVAYELQYPFPYLYDETQSVARAYDAACTPDLFVFDDELKLVYRGQFDDARPGNNKKVTGSDLRDALEAIGKKKPVNPDQIPSIGCNIKWKK